MRANIRVMGMDGDSESGVGNAVNQEPLSVYELLTRQMLEQVKADVAEVKSRVNTLFWLVVGAMLVEVVMRMIK